MRIPALSVQPAQGTVQITLPSEEQQMLELIPGDKLSGQVLRMVDNQATLQIGDQVLTVRSSVPLAPGAIVLQVEDQIEGTWRLRMLSNEPPLYLVQEQLIDLRLNLDASREMLMKALLGQIPVDREVFLQAEQLWKTVERQPDWLPALVQLFKNRGNGVISEAMLSEIKSSLDQSGTPGWLQNKANEGAALLLRQWGLEATPPRLELLSTLLQAAPDLAETGFSPERWAAAWDQTEVSVTAEESAIIETQPRPVLQSEPRGMPSTLGDASRATLAVTRGSLPASTNTVENSEFSIYQRDPTLPEGAARFSLLERVWSDLGRSPGLLPALTRLFYSEKPVSGAILLQQFAEQESRGHFAELRLSEVEMGDKRGLLRQMGLAERPERLVILQKLNQGAYRADREEVLRAERLWRELGGREQDLENIARVVTDRLPVEVSSVWALRVAEENRLQTPVVYLWMNLSAEEPVMSAHVVQPQAEKQSSERGDTEQPLLLLGFRTERLGPALLRVTPQVESYRLRLTVHELWRHEVEQQAITDLLPRLRAVLPRFHWQVQSMKETLSAKNEEHKAEQVVKRRLDFRV